MNVEKGLFLAAVLFTSGVCIFFGMQSALTQHSFPVDRMVIEKEMIITGIPSVEPYSLSVKADPFKEKSDASNMQVTIEMPPFPDTSIEKPPVFWKKGNDK